MEKIVRTGRQIQKNKPEPKSVSLKTPEFSIDKLYILSRLAKSDKLSADFASKIDELEVQLAITLEEVAQKDKEIKYLTQLAEEKYRNHSNLANKIKSLLAQMERSQNDIFAGDRTIVALSEANDALHKECSNLKRTIERLSLEIILLLKNNE